MLLKIEEKMIYALFERATKSGDSKWLNFNLIWNELVVKSEDDRLRKGLLAAMIICAALCNNKWIIYALMIANSSTFRRTSMRTHERDEEEETKMVIIISNDFI